MSPKYCEPQVLLAPSTVSRLCGHASEGCKTGACPLSLSFTASTQAERSVGSCFLQTLAGSMNSEKCVRKWECGNVCGNDVQVLWKFYILTSQDGTHIHTCVRAPTHLPTHIHKWKKKLVYPLDNPHRDCCHIFVCQSVEEEKRL